MPSTGPSSSRGVTTTTSPSTPLIDNPCWGSPTQCTLEHLLRAFSRHKSILYESPDYIVLNKPPDLRMDGPYPATVHKLLAYWYPSPSLLTSSDLLTTVSQLHEHVVDNELRPCHQLDYATSGVLLVARSRLAAAAATRAFSTRQAEKVYLAVVCGCLNISNEWPVLEKGRLQALDDEETNYRQKKAKRRDDTFQGFMPAHAMFHKWQAHVMKKRRNKDTDESNKSKRQKRQVAVDLDDLWQQAIALEDTVLTPQELEQLLASSWKQVKQNQVWKRLLERLTDLYNDALRQQHPAPDSTHLPPLFRIQGEPENSFYIFASLAQVQDDFCMRLAPDTLFGSSKFQGTPDMDYKPALTRCVVLEHCKNGDTMTKVQLEPKTGRRHQLRLHMVVAGHAIVGDATYNSSHESTCQRMCLHAYSLSLPVLHDTTLSVTAPDPFVITNGTLMCMADTCVPEKKDESVEPRQSEQSL